MHVLAVFLSDKKVTGKVAFCQLLPRHEISKWVMLRLWNCRGCLCRDCLCVCRFLVLRRRTVRQTHLLVFWSAWSLSMKVTCFSASPRQVTHGVIAKIRVGRRVRRKRFNQNTPKSSTMISCVPPSREDGQPLPLMELASREYKCADLRGPLEDHCVQRRTPANLRQRLVTPNSSV